MKRSAPSLIWMKPLWSCSECAWTFLPAAKSRGRTPNPPEASHETAGAFLDHRCARYPREICKQAIP
jgi:hypothetical protein